MNKKLDLIDISDFIENAKEMLKHEKRLVKVVRRPDRISKYHIVDYVGMEYNRYIVLGLVWNDGTITEHEVWCEMTFDPDKPKDYPMNAREIVELSAYASKYIIGLTPNEVEKTIDTAIHNFRNSVEMKNLEIKIKKDRIDAEIEGLKTEKNRYD